MKLVFKERGLNVYELEEKEKEKYKKKYFVITNFLHYYFENNDDEVLIKQSLGKKYVVLLDTLMEAKLYIKLVLSNIAISNCKFRMNNISEFADKITIPEMPEELL